MSKYQIKMNGSWICGDYLVIKRDGDPASLESHRPISLASRHSKRVTQRPFDHSSVPRRVFIVTVRSALLKESWCPTIRAR